MTNEQRIQEISRRCKLPVSMIKQVLAEETSIIVDELMSGNKAVMYGRVVLTPRIQVYVDDAGKEHKVMKVSCKPSQALMSQLESMSELSEIKGQDISISERDDGYIVKSMV